MEHSSKTVWYCIKLIKAKKYKSWNFANVYPKSNFGAQKFSLEVALTFRISDKTKKKVLLSKFMEDLGEAALQISVEDNNFKKPRKLL